MVRQKCLTFIKSRLISNGYFRAKEVIEFSSRQYYENPKYVFPLEIFLVDGHIPLPPN